MNAPVSELQELMGNNVKSFIEIVEQYDDGSILQFLAAIQLEPANHGKSIRIERMLFEVLKSGKKTGKNLSTTLCRKICEWAVHDYQEDPVSSFFTENTIFFSGNHTVFPGIASNGTQILNNLLESILSIRNNLPVEYCAVVEQGASFMLTLSESMASESGHKRYKYEDDFMGALKFPDEEKWNTYRSAVFFSDSYLKRVYQTLDLTTLVAADFITTIADLEDNYDPDGFILTRKPLLVFENGMLFAMPSAVVTAISEFIKRKAVEFNCEAAVIENYHRWQWKKVQYLFTEIGWNFTDIQLPTPTGDINIREAILQFDSDKLAYVCMLKHGPSFKESPKLGDGMMTIQQRNEQILTHLKSLHTGKSFRYFSIILLGDIGETQFFAWMKPDSGNQTLGLSLADFEKMIYSGDMKGLGLWKFAKAYHKATEKIRFGPFTSVMDAYSYYKDNHCSLLPQEQQAPSFMMIQIGNAGELERSIIAHRDEHAARKYANGRIVYVPVIRCKDYAPLYTERELSFENRILLESFSFPLWISNHQATNLSERSFSIDYIEAVAFWLYKMKADLAPFVQKLTKPVEFRIILDKKFLESTQISEWDQAPDLLPFSVQLDDLIVIINVPFEICHLLITEHNEGERQLMRNILRGLNLVLQSNNLTLISDSKISEIIDRNIPYGNAKMILVIDSSKDPRLYSNDLISASYIQESETSFILDNIQDYLPEGTIIPDDVTELDEKKKLLRKLVAGLIRRLEEKLHRFIASELIKWLVMYNEKFIRDNEIQEIEIPARIACFSSYPDELKNYRNKQSQSVSSSLSVRCLIEIVAAIQPKGDQIVNRDDIDELLALMNEICQWGFIADTIHYEMNNPSMGLLPSGRLGMNYDFFHDYLMPFGDAVAEMDLKDFVQGFDERMEVIPASHGPEKIETKKSFGDDAFKDEFGISFSQLVSIKKILIQLGLNKMKSVMKMKEDELCNAIISNEANLDITTVQTAIKLLSIPQRKSISTPPEGFVMDDILPWRFNREISYIRRPLIPILGENGDPNKYVWGFRHMMSSRQNLKGLLTKGQIKAKQGGKLSSALAEINAAKGKYFRNMVCDWLKSNTNLEVIDYEVTIRPKGHLNADMDLGDIDILAIDKDKTIVYSIECKNTVSARAIHEMKTELDKYLGRNGSPGLIDKHAERDRWLNANRNLLERFTESKGPVTIHSFILTSQEIPLTYFAKDKLQLPFVSFKRLSHNGWNTFIAGLKKFQQ